MNIPLRRLLGLSVSILLLGGFPRVMNADLGAINIRISATIVSNTCQVSGSSLNQTVNLGVWASRQFFSGPVTATTYVPFAIVLEKCGPVAKGVKIKFSGIKDATNNELYALNASSTAKNVAVEIVDRNKLRIPPSWYTYYALTSNAQQASFPYYARYMATGGPVQPGSANAEATFVLEYD